MSESVDSKQHDDALREEIKRRMRQPSGEPYPSGEVVNIAKAIAVALEVAAKERRMRWMMEAAQRTDIEMRKDAEKRAEAAEAALAEARTVARSELASEVLDRFRSAADFNGENWEWLNRVASRATEVKK